jgi:hypothetical protein
MKPKNQIRRFVIFQIIIIAVAIGALFAGEYSNFAHTIGSVIVQTVPIREVAWEGALFLVVLAAELIVSVRFLRRVIYLENFMLICSNCSKIKIGNEWIPMADYLTKKTDVVFSHGLCPTCFKEFAEKE